jgi:hypothetical protein
VNVRYKARPACSVAPSEDPHFTSFRPEWIVCGQDGTKRDPVGELAEAVRREWLVFGGYERGTV